MEDLSANLGSHRRKSAGKSFQCTMVRISFWTFELHLIWLIFNSWQLNLVCSQNCIQFNLDCDHAKITIFRLNLWYNFNEQIMQWHTKKKQTENQNLKSNKIIMKMFKQYFKMHDLVNISHALTVNLRPHKLSTKATTDGTPTQQSILSITTTVIGLFTGGGGWFFFFSRNHSQLNEFPNRKLIWTHSLKAAISQVRINGSARWYQEENMEVDEEKGYNTSQSNEQDL